MRLAAGTRLGSYEIVSPLGEGGMGQVFLARDVTLHRSVALKLVADSPASDDARRHLLREARNAAALNHPHICTIHEVGQVGDVSFIAMEYVEGRSLRDHLRDGALSVEDALRYAEQAADALAYAHSHGVIHRDLKAANVMITLDGRVKIVDFGLARRSDQQLDAATTIGTMVPKGVVAGTPYAMAPEQVRGEDADERTDIWALGVLLYEMLAGTAPFGPGQSLPDLYSAILRDDAAPLPAGVPGSIRGIVDRCLKKERGQRYQSAAELCAALRAPRSPVAAPRRRVGAPVMAAAALVVTAVASIGILRGVEGWRVRPPAPAAASLAILPFVDQDGDPDQRYFADGVTDALAWRLSGIGSLRVVPRSLVASYEATPRSPADIARELGVDAVLSGAVRRDATGIQVSLTLTDTAAGETWEQQYDADVTSVLGLHAQMASAVARQLRLPLTPSDERHLASRTRPVNPSAYDFYLRGITLLERVNTADTEAAIGMFERAVAADSQFADAFGALAAAYFQLYSGYQPGEAERLEPKVRAAIDRALSLDPDSPDALAAQGDLGWDTAHGWRHGDAVDAHLRALAIKPSLERSRRRLAVIFNHVGLTELARGYLAQSDDSPATLMQRGLASFIEGDHELALAAWLAIPPGTRNTNHIGHIAWGLATLGRFGEARTLLRDVPPGTVDVNGMLAGAAAVLHAAAGERPLAERSITAATARATDTQESHHATYLAAVAHSRLGNPAEALRWLRFTAANGYPCYPLMLRDAGLDSLRSYPPFAQFLEEMRIRWEGYRARFAAASPGA